MDKFQQYTTLKLTWEQVAISIGELISALLGREVCCQAATEDDDYWNVNIVKRTLSSDEIVTLVNHVEGDHTMLRSNLPDDSDYSLFLDMDLCRGLLRKALQLDWEVEMLSDDSLWLTGSFDGMDRVAPQKRNLIHIDSKLIDCTQLMSQEELVDRLFAEGGTYTALNEICDEYYRKWHTSLYWTYPITDGSYNGCYFILVKEGVLIISYDEISDYEHEVFDRRSVRLCTAEVMTYFMDDWNRYNTDLTKTMEELHAFLRRQEEKKENTPEAGRKEIT